MGYCKVNTDFFPPSLMTFLGLFHEKIGWNFFLLIYVSCHRSPCVQRIASGWFKFIGLMVFRGFFIYREPIKKQKNTKNTAH